MADTQIRDEYELVQVLRKKEAYQEFLQKYLQPKIEREKLAWAKLSEHRGKYTEEILEEVFDKLEAPLPDNICQFILSQDGREFLVNF